MTCYLHGSTLLVLQNMNASMPHFISYLELHKSLLDVGWGNTHALVRNTNTTRAIREYHLWNVVLLEKILWKLPENKKQDKGRENKCSIHRSLSQPPKVKWKAQSPMRTKGKGELPLPTYSTQGWVSLLYTWYLWEVGIIATPDQQPKVPLLARDEQGVSLGGLVDGRYGPISTVN